MEKCGNNGCIMYRKSKESKCYNYDRYTVHGCKNYKPEEAMGKISEEMADKLATNHCKSISNEYMRKKGIQSMIKAWKEADLIEESAIDKARRLAKEVREKLQGEEAWAIDVMIQEYEKAYKEK